MKCYVLIEVVTNEENVYLTSSCLSVSSSYARARESLLLWSGREKMSDLAKISSSEFLTSFERFKKKDGLFYQYFISVNLFFN